MAREPVAGDRAKAAVKPLRALAAVPDPPAAHRPRPDLHADHRLDLPAEHHPDLLADHRPDVPSGHRLEPADAELPAVSHLQTEGAGADVRVADVADAALIVGSRASPELFAVLFDRHAAAIHRYVARRLGTTEADDLLGQTFLLAFERRHRYDESRAHALPWLYGIATNLVHRRRRDEVRQYRAYARTGADRDHDGLAAEVADRLDAAVTTRALSGVLAELRSAERDVLLLYAWEDLSYPEIATALDIPIGTVRSRLYRARRALRTALGSASEETTDE